MRAEPSDANFDASCAVLAAARPTAVNLQWATHSMREHLLAFAPSERAEASFAHAGSQDVGLCRTIGEHGLRLIRAAAASKQGRRVNVLATATKPRKVVIAANTPVISINTMSIIASYGIDAGIDAQPP